MKVLFITGSFPPMKCGVGDYTARLAEAIAKHPGVSVAVLTDVAAADGKQLPGVDILPVANGWHIRDALQIMKAIRSLSPDVTHIQYPSLGYRFPYLSAILPILTRMSGVQVVQTWHERAHQGAFLIQINRLFTRKIVVVRPDFTKGMSPVYRWLVENRDFRYIPIASSIPSVRLSGPERKAVASRYSRTGRSLIVHFGFAFAHKGVEQIFMIADPERDHVVLACDLSDSDPYQRTIRELADSPPWSGKVTITGFLPTEELARLLSAADAVVFPFRTGSAQNSSSIYAAIAQGNFVLTTSPERNGYFREQNAYYAMPENTDEMRNALRQYIGHRNERAQDASDWTEIAKTHVELYQSILKRPS